MKHPAGDGNGNLSDAALTMIASAVTQKVNSPPCEMCGKKAWFFRNTLLSPAVIIPHPFMPSGPDLSSFVPCFGLECSHCGNLKLFNLARYGLESIASEGVVHTEDADDRQEK